MRYPILILSPFLGMGIPENAGVRYQFRPLLGPREGMGEVATSDFFLCSWGWGPPRMHWLRRNSALFCAPEKAGVR